MSKVGKLPITIPQGVKISLAGRTVKLEGPKGKAEYPLGKGIGAVSEGNEFKLALEENTRQAKANWGTARAVINGMILGLTQGWKRRLEMVGVGYKANIVGQKLTLFTGYSHEVVIDLPAAVKCTVEKNTIIQLESHDRQLMGNFAAKIRKVRKPEPYLGKGIKYSDEVVRRKAGKTGKK